jgi:hypothetical protein
MRVTEARLNDIYKRTSGYCHLCGKRLAFTNYGRFGRRGAWEIEHSVARINGGTDRLCNLYAACISCNRSKQHFTTRTARRWNGRTRAPLSVARRKQERLSNTLAGAGLGLICGLPFGGIGALAGPLLGAMFGSRQNPDKFPFT